MLTRSLLLAALILFVTRGADAGTARYVVTADEQDRRLVRVHATITSHEDVLMMYPEGASHVPQGWATYLRNVVSSATLEPAGPGQWRNPAKGKPVTINYEVLIHHDAGFWPFGWDEAAYVKGTAVFMTGKALFITALDVVRPEIEFRLPAKWQLITPWEKVGGGRYVAADAVELTEAALLTGRFEARTITSGEVTVLLGMGTQMKESVPLFEETIRAVLPIAHSIFGGTPRGTYVVIANREEEFTGGGAFVRSMSMLFQEAPSAANRAEWAHVLVHEIVHLWLGRAIESNDAWFIEGFTDYIANRIEQRAGILTDAQFAARVEEHRKKYAAVADRVSLQAAGADKGKYYDLIYSGGLLFALALDDELQKRSGGSLADVLRLLYAAGKPVTLESLISATNRFAGADLQPMFEHYVLRDRR